MAKPKKRKPTRRKKSAEKKSVYGQSGPVDALSGEDLKAPRNWGRADELPGARTRVCHEATEDRLLRTHAISHAQRHAWHVARRVHERFCAAGQANISSYGEGGGGYSDREPEWYVSSWPIYRAWMNGWPGNTVGRYLIDAVILGGLTIAAAIKRTGISRPKAMKNLLAVLDDLVARQQGLRG
ncbi:MAG: hypothetical protein JKY34_11240 [Kordiimonadaceae bacterium]|nr:hypothetical protein [Kordiimonadaceae bacterium]